jgi:hypothetical protein
VVTSRRRVGTVIAEPPAGAAGTGEALADAARPASDPSGLVGEARALVARARAQGLSDEAVLALVRGALLPESR